MAERKILVGDIQGGIPIHTGFDSGDTLVDPSGSPISTGGGTALTPDFYRTAELVGAKSGVIAANSIVLAIPITEPLVLPTNGMGSKVMCYTAPSAVTIFTIKKAADGVGGTSTTVGTFRFAAGGKTATFDTYSQMSFAAGDVFEVYAPSVTNGVADMIFSFGVYMLNASNTSIPAPGNIVSLGRYTYTGGETLVQVPGNCNNISVKAWGAGGGGSKGGAGGYVQGTLPVIGGTWLSIKVGGAGLTVPTYADSGGGGMSSAFVIADNTPLFIAAGGGGADGSTGAGGAGGGLTGQAGTGTGAGGTGGTQSAGGTVNGMLYQGGNGQGVTIPVGGGYNGGGNFQYNGGYSTGAGGGGGYYGGGGGGDSAGGGGGSSMVPSGGLTLGGDRTTPGNSTDPDRGTAGNPGQPGLIIITYMQ